MKREHKYKINTIHKKAQYEHIMLLWLSFNHYYFFKDSLSLKSDYFINWSYFYSVLLHFDLIMTKQFATEWLSGLQYCLSKVQIFTSHLNVFLKYEMCYSVNVENIIIWYIPSFHACIAKFIPWLKIWILFKEIISEKDENNSLRFVS